jgi:hypothetical protein
VFAVSQYENTEFCVIRCTSFPLVPILARSFIFFTSTQHNISNEFGMFYLYARTLDMAKHVSQLRGSKNSTNLNRSKFHPESKFTEIFPARSGVSLPIPSARFLLLHCPINLLKTKRNLLYIRNQSVPRCKHFPPRL